MLYATIEITTKNPQSSNLYTLARFNKTDVNLQEFKQDWLECLANRHEMDHDDGIMDIAWMLKQLQYYGWELTSKDIPISLSLAI